MCISTEHPLTDLQPTHRIIKRAQYEAFTFVPTASGVRVRNESHAHPAAHEYHVTVVEGVPTKCTCPADKHGDDACKHRVAVAIRQPVLSVATDPSAEPIPFDATGGELDGFGESEDVVPKTKVSESGHGSDEKSKDPSCECAELGGSFPCWYCVRTGQKSIPSNSEAMNSAEKTANQ